MDRTTSDFNVRSLHQFHRRHAWTRPQAVLASVTPLEHPWSIAKIASSGRVSSVQVSKAWEICVFALADLPQAIFAPTSIARLQMVLLTHFFLPRSAIHSLSLLHANLKFWPILASIS